MSCDPTFSPDLPPGAIVITGGLTLVGPPGDLSDPGSVADAIRSDASAHTRQECARLVTVQPVDSP